MGVGDDAAILTSPDSSKLTIQTIDYFRSFISDPYLFGKIAANHALSDLHAMNGDPISALALCVLPFGKEDKVENDLVQVNYYYSKNMLYYYQNESSLSFIPFLHQSDDCWGLLDTQKRRVLFSRRPQLGGLRNVNMHI